MSIHNEIVLATPGPLATMVRAAHDTTAERHRRHRTAAPDRLRASYEADIAQLSAHTSAVKAFLLPAARRTHHDRGQTHEVLMQAHATERVLRLIQGRLHGAQHSVSLSIVRLHEELAALVAASADGQHGLAAHLDSVLGHERGTVLADAMHTASQHGPTRPHPYAPHGHGMARLSFRLCAMIDHAMDSMDGRVMAAA